MSWVSYYYSILGGNYKQERLRAKGVCINYTLDYSCKLSMQENGQAEVLLKPILKSTTVNGHHSSTSKLNRRGLQTSEQIVTNKIIRIYNLRYNMPSQQTIIQVNYF